MTLVCYQRVAGRLIEDHSGCNGPAQLGANEGGDKKSESRHGLTSLALASDSVTARSANSPLMA